VLRNERRAGISRQGLGNTASMALVDIGLVTGERDALTAVDPLLDVGE
jgi:hypothetical protein